MVVEISLTKKCYGITEGRTEGRTDGTTDRCKPVYPPLFQSGGIITKFLHKNIFCDTSLELSHQDGSKEGSHVFIEK